MTLELPEAPEHLRAELAAGGAVAWSAPLVIPTYAPGEPDRYPMYFERRVYQGSSGRVYPLPFIDSVATRSAPVTWQAIHLENRWIRLVVLPEIGGRIHVAVDKVAGYDFFYRNSVIKPALVGLAGPWISGGVEFNWPQHHRPATFLPVDTRIERHDDGSVTVWCSDHDPFTRMRGTHGIRLHPDRAIVDLVVRLHNRTDVTQTFLWWANAAVHVHERYQSFFPTDVHWVADHAGRAVTAFPAADRPYYGVDYPARAAQGGDRLDFWAHIPVPTSYMVLDTDDDFFGGYDHAAGAGFVHVADRRIAPGKKQWTWGNSAFGDAWTALLTDEDGPYIELMSGVFTDNQPDFAWLLPGETREFTQCWFPIQEIGPVHQANRDLAVRLDVEHESASIGVAATREFAGAAVEIRVDGSLVRRWTADLAPGRPFHGVAGVATDDPTSVEARVVVGGEPLLTWTPRPTGRPSEPPVAVAPGPPAELESVEELVLTGRHLAQYRHPTRSPRPYWEEAVRRDPGHSSARLALAELELGRGLPAEAEAHLRIAVRRLTARNRNPRDGEVFYLLGLAVMMQGRDEEALDAFGKASWNRAWIGPAGVQIARIEARRGRLDLALDAVRRARRADPGDVRAAVLEICLLRAVDPAAAADALRATRREEPLDLVVAALDGGLSIDPRSVLDAAREIAAAGAIDEALELLASVERIAPIASDPRPLAHYERARLLDVVGRSEEAGRARAAARRAHRSHCFPSGLDDLRTLLAARNAEPEDVIARHLLALLLVGLDRPDDAAREWAVAIDLGLDDAVAHRTAAILAFNRGDDPTLALDGFERALALRPNDARLWVESDQLCERLGWSPERRRARLEQSLATVLERDDGAAEYAALLVATGDPEAALDLLRSRAFAPWEGGEGRVLGVWDAAWAALADAATAAGDPVGALEHLERALDLPTTLGEARHPLEPSRLLAAARARARAALGLSAEAESATLAVGPAPDDFFATSEPDLLLFTRRLDDHAAEPRATEPRTTESRPTESPP